MALISGLLKGPYGDPRSGVTITMRSIKTSSTVLNLAKSQSVTDDGGKYSLSVEPVHTKSLCLFTALSRNG